MNPKKKKIIGKNYDTKKKTNFKIGKKYLIVNLMLGLVGGIRPITRGFPRLVKHKSLDRDNG